MLDPNSSPAITAEELFQAVGDSSATGVAAVWRVLQPIGEGQAELTGLLKARDKVLAKTRTPEENAVHTVESLDKAIRFRMGELLLLNSTGMNRVMIATASEAKADLPAQPDELAAVMQKSDVWQGSYWPSTLVDWCSALGLPANTSKVGVLSAITKKDQEYKAREVRAWAEKTLDGFNAAGARLFAARTMIEDGNTSQRDLLRVHLAAEMAKHLTPRAHTRYEVGKLAMFRVNSDAIAGESLPFRIKVLNWGRNPSTKGDIVFDQVSVAALAVTQRAAGFDKVALDFEHNTVPGSTEYERTKEPRSVAAYGTVKAISGDGLYLDELEWTPEGQVGARNFKDLSPAVALDAEQRVRFVHSVALVRNGAVHGMNFFRA